jgi:hypothetical protein
MRRFEFHDSVIQKIIFDDKHIKIIFSEGTVYYGDQVNDYELKLVTVIIKNARGELERLGGVVDADVYDGELYCDDKSLNNINLPLHFDGKVQFKFQLNEGKVFNILGSGIEIRE